MAEWSINGNGIPCVFTHFSGAGRLDLASTATDRFARGSRAILDAGWRVGADAAEIPLDGEVVYIPQNN
jgi:hypothetical protein